MNSKQTFEELENALEKEYEQLCKLCNFEKVTFAVVPVNAGVNDYYSKKHKLILIFLNVGNLNDNINLKFPPKNYYFNNVLNEWPLWRRTLWHEFIHQIQHFTIDDVKEFHQDNEKWTDAVKYLWEKLPNKDGLTMDQLSEICNAY